MAGAAMATNLFRDDVMQRQRRRWLGRVRLDQPPALRWASALVLLAGVLAAALLSVGSYTRRTTVVGELVPGEGVVTVMAPVAGTLAEVDAAEGQAVVAGQRLALVRVPGETRRGDVHARLLAAWEQRRHAAELAAEARRERLDTLDEALPRQLAVLEEERRRTGDELSLRESQRALAQRLLDRQHELRAARYVTDAQVAQQQAQVIEAAATVQVLHRLQATQRRQALQLRREIDDLAVQRRELDVETLRSQAALAVEGEQLAAQGEAVVLAPRAGDVGARLVQPGQAVQAGQPLFTVLPAASPLQAHLAVPGDRLGFIAVGDTVRLRIAAYPFARFGHHAGRVLRISGGPLPAQAGAVPLYRVVVALESQEVVSGARRQALRAGLRVDADILGERRRLWAWAIEPLWRLRAATEGASARRASALHDGARSARAVREIPEASCEVVRASRPISGLHAFGRVEGRCPSVASAVAGPLHRAAVSMVSCDCPHGAGIERETCHA